MWRYLKRFASESCSHQQVTQFTRHFAELLAADVQVSDALQLIAGSQGNPAPSKIAASLLAQLNEGRSFATAVEHYPRWFPPMYRQLAATGEATARLPQLMGHLASYRLANEAVTAKLKRASGYPLLILFFAATMLVGLLTLVVPRFRELFADSGAGLPALTRVIIALSDGLVVHWMPFLLLCCTLLCAVVVLLRLAAMRSLLLRIGYRLPFVGSLLIARHRELFLRSLALMIASRMPLTHAIEQLLVSANPLWEKGLQRLLRALYQGASLEEAMRQGRLFAQADLFAARIGQSSARLDRLLEQQADQYAATIEKYLRRLVMLLEPGLMLGVGLIIALIVLAVYLPLFSIGQAL